MQSLRIKYLFIGILALMLASPVICQSVEEVKELNRPSVGLVLSGGGAKGYAYIGLLKVLEEVNMPIDYIGGSSIGAIVAGLYSIGYSPETIEELVRAEDWNAVINDQQERKYIAFEEKLYNDKYIFSIPIQGEGFSLRNSLSSSFNIDLMLNRFFSPAAHISDFNKLPIPFLCIGTDLLTGEAIVLDSGNLARAVRASMAIPGYFSPTFYQNHYLIDGGVVNNYPAEQIKNLGADIIIGGDVQSGLKNNIEDLGSVTSILDQIISFHRTDANKLGKELTDYYVHIKLSYGMMDFTEYDSIIAIGERVAREHYPQLKQLADSLNNLQANEKTPPDTKPLESISIDSIIWPDISSKQHERFIGYFDGVNSKNTSLNEIEKRMRLLNGTNSFDGLHYQLETDSVKNTKLEIFANTFNKGSFSAGIHYDNDYHGSILVNIALRNIGGTRSKWFTDIVFSENPRINSMFIINNGYKPGFGLEANLYSFSFPEYSSDIKINTWQFDNISLGTFIPLTIKNNFLFKAGLKYELFRFKQDVIVDSLLDAYNEFADYTNLYVSFNLDTRDRVNFTQKGAQIELKLKHIMPLSNKWDDFITNASIGYLKYNYNLNFLDKLVFKPGLFLGYTFSRSSVVQYPTTGIAYQVPAVQHLFGFGGQNPVNYVESHIPFTGLRFNESLGQYAGVVSAKLQYNYYKKLYATLLADVGFNEMQTQSIIYDNLLLGYGLKLGYDSFIGPIEISIMESNISSSYSAYINLGFWF